jgi:hypothetical protein
MKGRLEGFDSVVHVFAGDIIEVREVPAQGVLAHFHEDPEPGEQHIYTSLPGVRTEFCVSCGIGDEGDTEIEPFASFEE